MINFKGKLALSTEIQQLSQGNIYKQVPASFVELDITSKDDLIALRNIAQDWKNNDRFAAEIYNDFKYDFKYPTDEDRYFVLTKQDANHNKLDYSKALGVAKLYKSEDKPMLIDYLQTNPKYINTNSKKLPEMKHIGKTIVESLKKILNNREIWLYTDSEIVPFYEKLGFKEKINSGLECALMIFKR